MRVLSSGLFLAGLFLLASSPAPSAADDFKLEEGFTLLFNGKDLNGWKTKKGDSLDDKTDAFGQRFKVKDGILVIDPKVKGDVIIETAKALGKDVHIKFEFLPGEGCNNDLFFRGLKFDIKKGDVKNLKNDEWNTFEIIAEGDKVVFKNNGEVQKTGTTKVDKSPLGVRAELGPIQIRRMRVKEGS